MEQQQQQASNNAQADTQLAAKVLPDIVKYLPAWERVRAEEVAFTRMTGLTNVTRFVQYTGTDESVLPRGLIVRQFGKAVEEVFINRAEEAIVYEACSKGGLGPRIYGDEGHTRFEEFIECTVLQQPQMRESAWLRKVAVKLAHFHALRVDGLTRDSLFEKVFCGKLPIFDSVRAKVADSVAQGAFSAHEKAIVDKVVALSDADEVQTVRDAIKRLFGDEVVFSHNDLLCNNILIDKTPQQALCFIDFEYSQYNVRAFDIGNYFVESKWDYDFPDAPYFKFDATPVPAAAVDEFLAWYVMQTTHLRAEEGSTAPARRHFTGAEAAEDVAQLLNEARQNALYAQLTAAMPLAMALSNYFWAIWGIFMCKNPDIQFDYIEYASVRYAEYKTLRE